MSRRHVVQEVEILAETPVPAPVLAGADYDILASIEPRDTPAEPNLFDDESSTWSPVEGWSR